MAKRERDFSREALPPSTDPEKPGIRWKAIKREGQLEEGSPIRIPGTEDKYGEHLAVVQGTRYDSRDVGRGKPLPSRTPLMSAAGRLMRNAVGKPAVHFQRDELKVPRADLKRAPKR